MSSGNKVLPGPRRRFGQNFLTDPGYASRIVGLASLASSDTVVEIGPGRGAITRLLAERSCTVFALEIDRDLFCRLAEEFGDAGNVNIINADALDYDFGSLAARPDGSLKVIANLPYNVATPILFRLLEFRKLIDRMVLMFQKEVAERIVASPGGRDYGALSIFPQLYADIRMALTLPPGAFWPVPRVSSAVLVFDMLKEPRFEVQDEAALKNLVKAAFSQRRKKISNSLKGFLKNHVELKDVLSRADIDPSRRAETVTMEEFCRLANLFHELNPDISF